MRVCGTFRYWMARWTFQPWFCRAAWHSSVVTPCTVSCTCGELVVSACCQPQAVKTLWLEQGGTRAAPHLSSVSRKHCQAGAGTILIPGVFSLSWAQVQTPGHHRPSPESPRGP